MEINIWVSLINCDNTIGQFLYFTFFDFLQNNDGGGSPGTIIAAGYWNNDTNPITGLELVMSAGTFSGTCGLYGMN